MRANSGVAIIGVALFASALAATFEGECSGVTTSYAGKGVARYTW